MTTRVFGVEKHAWTSGNCSNAPDVPGTPRFCAEPHFSPWRKDPTSKSHRVT